MAQFNYKKQNNTKEAKSSVNLWPHDFYSQPKQGSANAAALSPKFAVKPKSAGITVVRMHAKAPPN